MDKTKILMTNGSLMMFTFDLHKVIISLKIFDLLFEWLLKTEFTVLCIINI